MSRRPASKGLGRGLSALLGDAGPEGAAAAPPPPDVSAVPIDLVKANPAQPRRRFDEAAAFADLDQLGIAPQCGFASTEEGNAITEDDQKRKLELVVKTAEAIWGGVAA